MLQAAVDAAHQTDRRPLVVGVTILTSLKGTELSDIGVTRSLPQQVEALADLAIDAGLDGVVASPREVAQLRARFGQKPTIVTPGIRGSGTNVSGPIDDQTRTLSAAEAVSAGASYIVVGRPIVSAQDPLASARSIAQELASRDSEEPGKSEQEA